MRKTSGITMMSLVIYVTLLTAFTGIALMVSNNLSTSVFQDKGMAADITAYDKVLYYLNKASIESTGVDLDNTNIYFSNGDSFSYDEYSQTLKLNDGVLSRNISNFSAQEQASGLINITFGFNRYSHSMQRTIILYVGE